jgi:hypothetical protein
LADPEEMSALVSISFQLVKTGALVSAAAAFGIEVTIQISDRRAIQKVFFILSLLIILPRKQI